jgi:DNA-binding transcriptional LysR family regulator
MLDAPPDILFHPMMSHEPVLITARDHPLARRKRISLKDVAKYPLILPPRDQSTHRIVALVFAEHSLQHNVKLEIGGYDVIKTYVRLGLGVSIVMSHCLRKDDQLHTASLKRWFPKRTYGLVLWKGRTLSRTAQNFVELASAGIPR